MKKLLVSCAFAVVVSMAGCSKYDDTDLQNRVGNLEQRVTTLEELCRQMNTNITSLQGLVTALQSNDWITSVTPARQNGEEVGYTITFANGEPVTIYHGKAGEKGQAGEKGKDGYTPEIGVRQDTDGIYYWTLDGSWLTDGSGKKIKAEGRDGSNGAQGETGEGGIQGPAGPAGSQGEPGKKGEDGITPQLKIENDYWYVSYDKGTTWQRLGKATGENGSSGSNGEDGDSFFRSIDTESSEEYVVFTLADGTEIKLPRYASLSITFDPEGEVEMTVNSTSEVAYTLVSSIAEVEIEVVASGGLKAKAVRTTRSTGTINIVAGAAIEEDSNVLVFVSNGEKTLVKKIIVVEGSGDDGKGDDGGNDDDQDNNIPDDMGLAFPDPNFRQYVLDNFDKDKDGKISQDEALKVTVMYCFSKKIESLEGVQYFTNLTSLYCGSNQLTSLDVSQNTALTYLSCYSNQLTSLDVSQNTALTSLSCGFNQLTSLDVSQNTALTKLSCYSNQLTSLDVSQNTVLTDLDCSANKMIELNCNGCALLKSISAYGNNLTNVNITSCTALEQLDCNRNQLQSLDISTNTALVGIGLQKNLLVTLDASNNTQLHNIDCPGNKLTSLILPKSTTFKELTCSSNQLTSLDISNLPALEILSCYSNQLTSLDVSQNTALTSLNCGSNQLTRLDVSQTNLGNSTLSNPLDCSPMNTLQTLILKREWSIKGITEDRSEDYIPTQTQIEYVN